MASFAPNFHHTAQDSPNNVAVDGNKKEPKETSDREDDGPPFQIVNRKKCGKSARGSVVSQPSDANQVNRNNENEKALHLENCICEMNTFFQHYRFCIYKLRGCGKCSEVEKLVNHRKTYYCTSKKCHKCWLVQDTEQFHEKSVNRTANASLDEPAANWPGSLNMKEANQFLETNNGNFKVLDYILKMDSKHYPKPLGLFLLEYRRFNVYAHIHYAAAFKTKVEDIECINLERYPKVPSIMHGRDTGTDTKPTVFLKKHHRKSGDPALEMAAACEAFFPKTMGRGWCRGDWNMKRSYKYFRDVGSVRKLIHDYITLVRN